MKNNVKVVIAAAGKGSRSGLDYPKCLYRVQNKSILERILFNTKHIDKHPVIIVSPDGFEQVNNEIVQLGLNVEIIVQKEPTGMGDAVLHFKHSKEYLRTENVLLIWGDIPFISLETINNSLDKFFSDQCSTDFLFPTRKVRNPYTFLKRDNNGNPCSLDESREAVNNKYLTGERDIGVFIFKKELIFNILSKRKKIGLGRKTHEHGFLYVIKELYKINSKIIALNIANSKECISLNTINDINKINNQSIL